MKIGWKAVQIAIAGFVIPYMAVYEPALMLQGDWTMVAVVYIVFKAVLSIGLWGAAAIGFLFAPLNMVERAFAAVAAFMLVAAIPLTDEIGFGMSAIFVIWHLLRSRRSANASAVRPDGNS